MKAGLRFIRLHEGLRASAAFFFDAPCFFFDQIFE
jgi:hypothetical protein